jgi:toxin FitB
VPGRNQFLSVLTVGELRFGIERLPAGPRRDRLEDWLTNDLLVVARRRVLPLNEPVLQRWGRLRASLKRTMPVIDSLIAATALHHGMALATRNVRDFAGLGLRVINPFGP